MVRLASNSVDLRRGIDHIGVSANAIIHDGKGNFLMMKRGPKARDEQGRWDICGGAIEFGESIDEAVKREVFEELCAKPTDIRFLVAYDAHREHKGAKSHWVALCHSARVDPLSVRIGEPHKIAEIGWFTTDNLPSPLHSQAQKTIDAAKVAKVIL